MAEDAMVYLIYALIGIVGFGVGAALFFWQNPYSRIKFMRKHLKKNYVMLRFLMKNRRGFERIEIVNIDEDVIFRNNKAIIADKGRIWRTDASNIMGHTDKDILIKPGTNKNEGFDFYAQSVRDMLKMELDVPVLYIDEDNFKPIEPFLEGQERASPVSSSWLNTALNNAINIEVKKKMASKNIDMKDIIMFCGLAICAYLCYSMSGTIDTMNTKLDGMNGRLTTLDTKLATITGSITQSTTDKPIVYTQTTGR